MSRGRVDYTVLVSEWTGRCYTLMVPPIIAYWIRFYSHVQWNWFEMNHFLRYSDYLTKNSLRAAPPFPFSLRAVVLLHNSAPGVAVYSKLQVSGCSRWACGVSSIPRCEELLVAHNLSAGEADCAVFTERDGNIDSWVCISAGSSPFASLSAKKIFYY